MSKTDSSSSGITILGLLGIAFVILKLIGIINWSWWYVTLPFWGTFALLLIILLSIGIFYIIKKLIFRLKLYFKKSKDDNR